MTLVRFYAIVHSLPNRSVTTLENNLFFTQVKSAANHISVLHIGNSLFKEIKEC
ncbi:hypothetical protein N836_18695 [Leptolyngbya sp. Heron Island J]|nr:hypothetical protein N836_18695 [Leptolyngbya sp. Heron Island J]